MLRVAVLASLLALLGLAGAVYAGCTTCFTAVLAERSGTNVRLTFTAYTDPGTPLPDTATAVLMQVDGNRTKCATITLQRNGTTYGGLFDAYGQYSHSGRVELAGQIYDFTVPLDGTPGQVNLSADQTPLRGFFSLNVTAAPVPVAAVATSAPTAAPAPAKLPSIDPTFVIGAAVVLITVLGAYVDRRRAFARTLAQ